MANTKKVLVVGVFVIAIVTIFFSYEFLAQSYQASLGGQTTTCPGSPTEKGKADVDKDNEDEVVILTAGNEHFFDRLENMIGSVHHWEPNLTIVAYDLGLTKKQVFKLKRMCNVEYRKFPFEKYPPYMKQLRFFAWKPIIIKEALQDYPLIFWEDSGQEFRAPITEIKEFIKSDGYFFDQSDTNFNHFCPQVMYDALGIPKDRHLYEGLGGLHGAVLGFRRDSRAYRNVLLPSVECSLNEYCIAPVGTDLGNYRYDQSILSLYSYKNGPFIIRKESKFNACTVGYCPEFDGIRDTDDPDFQQSERLILFSRRGFAVKPYRKKLCQRYLTNEEVEEEQKMLTEEKELESKIEKVEKHITQSTPTLGEPKDATIKEIMKKNREILDLFPIWISPDVYDHSRNNYGIPSYIKDKIDAPVGDEINIADAITYIAKVKMNGGKKLKYLELGVSVGKTFVQVAATVADSTLATIELENINPTMEYLLFDKHELASWRYYSSFSAPRLTNDSCTAYNTLIGGNANQVIFVSGDVRDENSWVPLKQMKFNIIFSDAVHDPNSIKTEMEYITKFGMLDPTNFLIWYDDLGGDMTKAFVNNFFTLQQIFPNLDERKNLGIVQARGWLGTNEYHHTNGLISSMDVQELIKELANL